MTTMKTTKTSTLHQLLAAAVLAPCALTACTDLASEDYKGDPLITVHGVVTNPQALTYTPADETRAMVLWSTSDQVLRAATTDVEPTFPASFSIDLFQPPPAEAFVEFDEEGHRVAIGLVAFMTDEQLEIYSAYFAATQAGESADLSTLGPVAVATGQLMYLDDEASAAALAPGFDHGASLAPHLGFNFLTYVETQCPDNATEDPTDSYPCQEQGLVDDSYEFDLVLSVNGTQTVE